MSSIDLTPTLRYTKLLEEQDLERKDISLCQAVYDFYVVNAGACKMIFVWIIWVIILLTFSCMNVEWSFINGLYFAISSLSTVGLWAIPSDSPDWCE
jgi:hypothetical protein